MIDDCFEPSRWIRVRPGTIPIGEPARLQREVRREALPLAERRTGATRSKCVRSEVGQREVVRGWVTGFEHAQRPRRRCDENSTEDHLDEFVTLLDARRARVVPHGFLAGSWFDADGPLHGESLPGSFRSRERRASTTRIVCERGAVDPSPDDHLRDAGLALGLAMIDALIPWATGVATSRGGASLGPAGATAGEAMATTLAPQLVELLAADVDQQRGTPLALVRSSLGPLTDVLREAGLTRPSRDDVDVAMAPDDDFGIAPRTFRDLGEEVHEAGIRWGVAKAFAHRARHAR
jgi:hypothetical protein